MFDEQQSEAGDLQGPPDRAAPKFGVHSEYGTLHQVMVGHLEDFVYPSWSENLRYLGPEITRILKDTGGRGLPVKDALPDVFDRTASQLEAVVETFRSRGVDVLRPRGYTAEEKEYLGALQNGHSLLYPADPVYVLGSHLIETCIRRPFRRKEVWPIRDVLTPLLEADDDARHVAMPQAVPTRADADGLGPGPFLEGGDIVILGRDVMVGVGPLTSNRAGARWLERYLRPFGYRVRQVELAGDYLHLLGVLCLVREGLLMAYLPALKNGLPAIVADWDVIELTLEEMLALGTVGMNLDPQTHMIDERHVRLIRELERRGMTCIPMPMDYLAYWGGAVRCVTLPTSRDP